MIGLAAFIAQFVVAAGGSVLYRSPCGVLITMAGVLDQLLLGLLEALSLTLSSLDQWPLGLAGATIGGSRLGAGPSADCGGFGSRSLGLFRSTVWSGH